MRLLLRGLIASMVLWVALPAQSQLSDPQIEAMVEALRQAAPKTATQNDGLYSEWQVKPGIIPDWSKRCIGRQLTPAQFEASRDMARSVVSCIARRELQNQYRATSNNEMAAVRRVACWWLTGNAMACNSASQAAYVQRVLRFYQQARTNPAATPPASPSPSPSGQPSPQPSPSPSPSPSAQPSPQPSPSPSPSPSAQPSPQPSPSTQQ